MNRSKREDYKRFVVFCLASLIIIAQTAIFAYVTADGMRETVFQILVSDLGRKIPDDHAFIIFHHGVDLLFSFADVYLAADIVFILSGVHLVDDISGITVTVDNQKSSGSVQSGINKAASPDPEDGYYNLDQRHFYDRTVCKEPAVIRVI